MTLLECAQLCLRFGEASLLASLATTPAPKPNHEKSRPGTPPALDIDAGPVSILEAGPFLITHV